MSEEEEIPKFPIKRISNSKYYERKRSSNKHKNYDTARNDKRENYDSTEDSEQSLFNMSKRKKRKIPFRNESDQSISSATSDSDDEQPKKELRQLKKKYSNLKKKYKVMKAEKWKWENSFIEKNKCINSLKMEVEKLNASSSEIINLLKPNNERHFQPHQPNLNIESDVNERSVSKNNESEVIHLGPVKVFKRDLALVESKKKNSIYVKELALLFWTEEELMARSVTGRKAPNSKVEKERKPPLTPEKLVAIKDTFRNRLINRRYPEHTIDIELKLTNKYLAEKISDLIKCKARRSLSYLEKARGNMNEADDDDS